jgi:hypothetical protein
MMTGRRFLFAGADSAAGAAADAGGGTTGGDGGEAGAGVAGGDGGVGVGAPAGGVDGGENDVVASAGGSLVASAHCWR